MVRRTGALGLIGLSLLCLAAPARLARAGGFDVSSRQSSKAMAMAGAFVAQAEDPSAVLHNIAALAFLGEKDPIVSAGLTTFNLNESLYQGLPPGIGAGTTGEQDSTQTLTPHVYAALPLGENGKIGAGVYSPFYLETDWASPDGFSGRFLTLSASVETVDVASGVAYKIGENLGVGVGVVYRSSDLSLGYRLASFDPSAGAVVDVASMGMEATLDDGIGWTAGLLTRAGAWSFGLVHHSAIEVDYDGEARLTQIATGNAGLDALIAATLPFDTDLSFRSQIEFPDVTTLGIAWQLSETALVELDVSQTGWSGFQNLELILPANSEFDRTIAQNFSDTTSYRVGGKLETGDGSIFRAGVSLEETPQPLTTLGPFYPDADTVSYSAGYSKDWLDVALVWVDVERRDTTTNVDDFNGTYNSNAWILGITVNK